MEIIRNNSQHERNWVKWTKYEANSSNKEKTPNFYRNQKQQQ